MSTPHTANKPPATASQLLTGAADWIENHGWLTGQFYDADGRTCAIGALHFAARGAGYGRDWRARQAAMTEAAGALADIAEEWNGKPIDGATAREQVIHWNNHGVIDGADAVVWMQKASARAAEMVR